jgi:tRNA (mo5U34)-methyltransferase
MNDPSAVAQRLCDAGLTTWAEQIPAQLTKQPVHGKQADWQAAIASLPQIATDTLNINQGTLQIGTKHGSTTTEREQLRAALQTLHPWRKGPYWIHGVKINTEWRSDWKWARLAKHIEPLAGRRVLDIGCSNGYHCWRMAAAGAYKVIGIDPTQQYHAQYRAIRRLLPDTAAGEQLRQQVIHLPIGIEAIPHQQHDFDTVFSMGILYHRRSPIEHLQALRGTLRPGGQLVLETLVLKDTNQNVLVPPGRYAKMRNLWFIPSVLLLETWLHRTGYRNIKTIDLTQTSFREQRRTNWMRFESLADYLDPKDTNLTLEGHPAPCRAIVLANA